MASVRSGSVAAAISGIRRGDVQAPDLAAGDLEAPRGPVRGRREHGPGAQRDDEVEEVRDARSLDLENAAEDECPHEQREQHGQEEPEPAEEGPGDPLLHEPRREVAECGAVMPDLGQIAAEAGGGWLDHALRRARACRGAGRAGHRLRWPAGRGLSDASSSPFARSRLSLRSSLTFLVCASSRRSFACASSCSSSCALSAAAWRRSISRVSCRVDFAEAFSPSTCFSNFLALARTALSSVSSACSSSVAGARVARPRRRSNSARRSCVRASSSSCQARSRSRSAGGGAARWHRRRPWPRAGPPGRSRSPAFRARGSSRRAPGRRRRARCRSGCSAPRPHAGQAGMSSPRGRPAFTRARLVEDRPEAEPLLGEHERFVEALGQPEERRAPRSGCAWRARACRRPPRRTARPGPRTSGSGGCRARSRARSASSSVAFGPSGGSPYARPSARIAKKCESVRSAGSRRKVKQRISRPSGRWGS